MSVAFKFRYIDSQRLQSYVYFLYYLWLWLSRLLNSLHFFNFSSLYRDWNWSWFDLLSLNDISRRLLSFLLYWLAGRRVR